MTAFGRYVPVELLGDGGFGIVHRARDTVLRRDVALKHLRTELAADVAMRERFLREAAALAQLRHPNIVRIYDVGEAEGLPYFVMDLLSGQTLADLGADRGLLPLSEVVPIIEQLAAGVDQLHRAGIVHRDIKPANVMVEPDGEVILMDLGIARLLESTPRTRGGALIGTPQAMSPEQVRGEPVGPPSDIYALGVLAFQLLTGRPPFSGTVAYVLHAHAFTPPVMVSSLNPDLPAGADALFDAVLAKQPGDRPACARAFARSLRLLLPAQPLPAPPTVDVASEVPVRRVEGPPVSPVAPTLRDQPRRDEEDVAGLQTALRVMPDQRGSRIRRRRGRVAGALSAGLMLAAASGLLLVVVRDAGRAPAASMPSPTGSSGTLPAVVSAASVIASVPATPAAAPRPASIGDLRVYDSILSGREGEFVAQGSVVACAELDRGDLVAPIVFVLSNEDGAEVARAPAGGGPCTPITLPEGPLPPGGYTVQASQQDWVLATTGFRAVAPPPTQTPAPPAVSASAGPAPTPPPARTAAVAGPATAAPPAVATPRTPTPTVAVATASATATPQRTPPPAVPR